MVGGPIDSDLTVLKEPARQSALKTYGRVRFDLGHQRRGQLNPREPARNEPIGVSDLFWEVWGSGTRRKRLGTAVGFMWVDS